MIDTVLSHIRYLTQELPHRGSTTDQERLAADYAARVFLQAGYTPNVQPFKSAVSSYYPALVFVLGELFSLVLFLLFPFAAIRGLAVGLAFVFLISVLLDAAFTDNPLSEILPKGKSQNVIAELPATGEVQKTLVIMGHIDSHRTPLLFSSPLWVKILKLLVPVGIVATVLQIIAMGTLIAWGGQGSPLFGVTALVFVFLAVVMAQADVTPYTTGANDNASGAATVLALAEYYKRRPFEHMAVYFVISGCEEVGAYGARSFAAEYKNKIPGAYWITLDGLAAEKASPAIIESETFLATIHSDQKLLSAAREIVSQIPELGAFMYENYQGAYTDSSPAALAGFKPISIIALRKDGTLPAWHTLQDDISHVDSDTLNRCVLFSVKLIEDISNKV